MTMHESILNQTVLAALAALGTLSLFAGYVLPRVRASLAELFDFIEWLLVRSRRTTRIWRGTPKRSQKGNVRLHNVSKTPVDCCRLPRTGVNRSEERNPL